MGRIVKDSFELCFVTHFPSGYFMNILHQVELRRRMDFMMWKILPGGALETLCGTVFVEIN